MDYADAAFLGRGPDNTPITIGIERKAILDLLDSMITGRLSGHQLPGLLAHYQVVYLIVEGMWRPNPKSGLLERRRGKGWIPVEFGSRRFMARDVYCFLNTLMIKVGIHVLCTSRLRETAQAIAALHHWWVEKEWAEHRSHMARSQISHGSSGSVSLVKAGLLRRMAAELPGIGWGKSLAVSRHFPSVAEMVAAGSEEWLKIEGIGKKISKEVVEVLYDKQ